MKPVLVMQIRRMGDLILTFPLLRNLQACFPDSPIRVVAQPCFYEPLRPFSGNIQFFSHQALPGLIHDSYEAVINLGGAPILAQYAQKAKSPLKLGPLTHQGNLHIAGFWHLYRESLTCNNRHNLFHWADLFRMDLQSAPWLQSVSPLSSAPKTGRIGLFLGASDALKRLDPLFWSRLARKLAAQGYKPVLMGGPQEGNLGEEVMARKTPAINFCGKTDLASLAAILQTLDLCITPDTGPMHLADLLGVKVLNLSMGNVNAAETGPYGSGQYVLQSSGSCAGCWECVRPDAVCKTAFSPYAIAKLADQLITGDITGISGNRVELLTTGRDELGLHTLEGATRPLRASLGNFWKSAFLKFSGQCSSMRLSSSLRDNFPHIASSMNKYLEQMKTALVKKRDLHQAGDAWRNYPTHIRIFAGFLDMTLQNANYQKAALARGMDQIEELQGALAV